ncbi:MAG: cupredoxin domain-containing protein [Oricola sp.]
MLLAAAAMVAGMPAFAADHAVMIKDFAFQPAKLNVAVGDTVTFTNGDSAPHTGTADDGSFNTGTINSGGKATVTISAAGDHAYHCNFHGSMKGSVAAK